MQKSLQGWLAVLSQTEQFIARVWKSPTHSFVHVLLAEYTRDGKCTVKGITVFTG